MPRPVELRGTGAANMDNPCSVMAAHGVGWEVQPTGEASQVENLTAQLSWAEDFVALMTMHDRALELCGRSDSELERDAANKLLARIEECVRVRHQEDPINP